MIALVFWTLISSVRGEVFVFFNCVIKYYYFNVLFSKHNILLKHDCERGILLFWEVHDYAVGTN